MSKKEALIRREVTRRRGFSLWYHVYGKSKLPEFFEKYPAEKLTDGDVTVSANEVMKTMEEKPEIFLTGSSAEGILEEHPGLIAILDEKTAKNYVTKKNIEHLNNVPDDLFGMYLKKKCFLSDEDFFRATNAQLTACFTGRRDILERIPKERWDEELLDLALDALMDYDLSVDYGISAPEELKGEKYWRVLCTVNGYYFRLLPEKYQYILNEGFVLNALKRNRSFVGYCHLLSALPEELKTHDICRIACVKHFAAVEYLPENLKNNSFYEELIEAGQPNFIMYIDLHTITTETFVKALCHPKASFIFSGKKIPKELLTPEVIHAMARHNSLSVVPNRLQDQEFFHIHLQYHGENLDKVPKGIINEDLCLLALQSNAYAARKAIPEEIKTDHFWEEVVKHRLFSSPADLPDAYCTKELVLETAKYMDDIPDKYLDDDTVLSILKQRKRIAPIDLKRYTSKAVYDYTMKQSSKEMYVHYMNQFPREYWEEEHLHDALTHDPKAIHLPGLTEDEIALSLQSFPDNILYVPDGYQRTERKKTDISFEDPSVEEPAHQEENPEKGFFQDVPGKKDGTQMTIFDFLTA